MSCSVGWNLCEVIPLLKCCVRRVEAQSVAMTEYAAASVYFTEERAAHWILGLKLLTLVHEIHVLKC